MPEADPSQNRILADSLDRTVGQAYQSIPIIQIRCVYATINTI